jgi:hypothetical protein
MGKPYAVTVHKRRGVLIIHTSTIHSFTHPSIQLFIHAFIHCDGAGVCRCGWTATSGHAATPTT